MKIFIEKRIEIITFFFMFLGMFVILMMFGETDLHYDDAIYWTLGKAYEWDCTNLAWGFRGYLLPFIFFLAYKTGKLFGNEFIGLWLLSAATFAFLHTYIFRRMADLLGLRTDNRIYTAVCGAAAGGISAILFRGLYKYALSDIYAFSAFLLTIIIFRDIVVCRDIKLTLRIISSFVLGFLMYGIYNVRTIYLFVSIGMLVVFIVIHFLSEYRKRLYEVPMLIIGLLAGMNPMIRMNRVQLGIYSWQVPTDGLMLFQIETGISVDRYATFVGENDRFPMGGLVFGDRLGQAILQYEGIEKLDSWGDYIRLLIKYPLDFIGIYTRHFISILYPIFPNQYIKSLDKNKGLFLILAFSLFFICGVYLLKVYRFDSKKLLILATVLFPCICILPGAVEIRFFFGLYYLLAMYSTMGIKDVKQVFGTNKLSYVMGFIVLFAIYVAGCGFVLSEIEQGAVVLSELRYDL